MENDSSTGDDPIAIITHSLGSYMVIDTLSTMEARDEARKYAAHVKQVFMMANQLPMLDLSDLTNFNQPEAGSLSKLVQLKGEYIRQNSNVDSDVTNQIQVVAFSDPNDLLSFKLRARDLQAPATNFAINDVLPGWLSVEGFNVTYTVEHWSILGLVSWPAYAHTKWWTDCRVPNFLAFGGDVTTR